MAPNPQQQLAISSPAPRKVVIAGPGSGKTFVLVNAVKQRISEGVDPKRIAVMTFTNAGAHEFTKRLEVQLGYCGTLHGFCFRLLNRFGDRIGYIPGSISILPGDEKERLVLSIASELGLKTSKAKLFRSIDDDEDNVKRVWEEYFFRLRSNNLVDFDGILTEAVRLGANVLPEFDELFVDEAQDSSRPDWAIYKLCFDGKRAFIVGDVDQSVFGFRGAEPRKLVELAANPDWQLITLETNYRSDVAICKCATALIAHNKERVPKMVLAYSTLPGEVHVDCYSDSVEEMAGVARSIMRWQKEGASVAVLLRTNYLAEQTRLLLQVYQIETGSGNTWMPHDWKKALVLVSLCVSPANDILAAKYLRFSKSEAEIKRMKLEAQVSEMPLIDRFDFIHNDNPLDVDLAKLPLFLAPNGISEASTTLIGQRIQLLEPDATLSDLLADLYSHESWNTQPEEDGKRVFVGTMHASKGREFDCVFCPAFEEGAIPPSRDEWDDSIEEERRIAFVAITRARHQLYLSYAEHRKPQWGEIQPRQPSRFIREMGLS